MNTKALIVIDIQNDITKNYKDIINNINKAIDWAHTQQIHVIYIRHENLSSGTRTFKHGTQGAALAPDLKIVSEHIFTKYKGNALSSEAFQKYINDHNLSTFYISGADASACVKSSCFNMRKMNYEVKVLSDCITSYDKKKIEPMLAYYQAKGCTVISLDRLIQKSGGLK